MAAQRIQNRPLRILILIVAVLIVAWTFYQEKRGQTQTGDLEYRMMTGVLDGTFQVIMVETPDRIFVLDSAYRGVFDVDDAEFVSRPEQVELMGKYDDLQYRLGFHRWVKEGNVQFRTTREIFNQITFSKAIKYKVDSKNPDVLIELSDQDQ